MLIVATVDGAIVRWVSDEWPQPGDMVDTGLSIEPVAQILYGPRAEGQLAECEQYVRSNREQHARSAPVPALLARSQQGIDPSVFSLN